jgi:hypothetical protein
VRDAAVITLANMFQSSSEYSDEHSDEDMMMNDDE